MLSTEILSIAQQHSGRKTLSVYIPVPVNTSDPVSSARIAIRNGLAAAGIALRTASHAERAEFDACASRLTARFNALSQPLAGHVWVAFVVVSGDLYDIAVPGELPAGVEPVVAWDTGPRLAPLLALSEIAPSVLVLVDHERALFFHVDGDTGVREMERFETHAKIETGAHMVDAAYAHHRAHVISEIGTMAGGGPIFLGGAADATAHIVDALPPQVRTRATIVPGIHFSSTIPEMNDAIARVEESAHAAQQRRLVTELLARAHSTRVGVLGVGPARIAIEQSAVDTLILSADVLRADACAAERLVRSALQQHARVHVVAGVAAALLDASAAGVAARLRYPIAAPSVAARA